MPDAEELKDKVDSESESENDEPESESDDSESENDESESDDGESESDEPEIKTKRSDHVPLAKYQSEHKKRQEIEKKLQEMQSVFSQQRDQHEIGQLAQHYVATFGVDEQTAQTWAQNAAAQKQQTQQIENRLLRLEIRDLAKTDEFYADAGSFTDEILRIMNEKNLNADQAYLFLRGPARLKEIEQDRKQRETVKRTTRDSKKVDTSMPAKTKTPYPLDDADKKALKRLQVAQPDKKWDAKKYFEIMKT